MRQVTPAKGYCRLELTGESLSLTIKRIRKGNKTVETTYKVVILDPDPEVAMPAINLIKADGETYTVHVAQGGHCDCPDFVYARDGKDEQGCKHCRALRAVGLLRPLPLDDERKRK